MQAKRCAEEFANAVRLEFIDRYVVNENPHLNIKQKFSLLPLFISFDVSFENFAGASMQPDITKIMAFIIMKLKGKFEVDLVVDLQTRFIAYW